MKKILGLVLAFVLCFGAAVAESDTIVDLVQYYGMDIHEAAEQIGGLTYSEGVWDEDEDPEGYWYDPDNYAGAGIALRGSGLLYEIELNEPNETYNLCGVSVGMDIDAALEVVKGYEHLKNVYSQEASEWGDGYYHYTLNDGPDDQDSDEYWRGFEWQQIIISYGMDGVVTRVLYFEGIFGA